MTNKEWLRAKKQEQYRLEKTISFGLFCASVCGLALLTVAILFS